MTARNSIFVFLKMSSNFSVTSLHILMVKAANFWLMQSYLKALGFWESLGENPKLNQIKLHEEEKFKKPKALFVIHVTLSDPIFARIIDCKMPKDAWDKLQEEFERSARVKCVKLWTLKRGFELPKMKDSDYMREYTTEVMNNKTSW